MRVRRKTPLLLLVAGVILANAPAAGAVDLYSFRGTVTDPLGRTLGAATVREGTKTASTAANGNYAIGESSTGRFTLTASRSDTNAPSKTVTVQIPLDQTVDFTLHYRMWGTLTKSAVSTASGPATVALNMTTTAPEPGTEGQAGGYSCVRVTDSRTGIKTPATYVSSSGGSSTWQYQFVVPEATQERSYALSYAAEDCAGTTAISVQASSSYVVDNTAPSLPPEGLVPSDFGVTVFESQPMVATVRDTGGSGLNTSSIKFKVTDDAGNVSDLNSTYSSATGLAKTAPMTLQAEKLYRLSVTAKDLAGNEASLEARTLEEGGGFLATTFSYATSLASIPPTVCRNEQRNLTDRFAVCENVPLHFDATTATLGGLRRSADVGFVEQQASLETAVVKTTIAGVPASAPAYQANSQQWAPRTESLRFQAAESTNSQTVTVDGRDVTIGTVEVPVSPAWTGDVTLEMAPTSTIASVSACADPTAATTSPVRCTPDPVHSRYVVLLSSSVDPTAVANEHAATHRLEVRNVYDNGTKAYNAFIPFPALAKIAADTRVIKVERDDRPDSASTATLSQEITIDTDAGTVTPGTPSQEVKTYDRFGNHTETTTSNPQVSTPPGGNYACINNDTDSTFYAYPTVRIVDPTPKWYSQFDFHPYQYQYARQVVGTGYTQQWIICSNGGTDPHGGWRISISGSGSSYNDAATSKRQGWNWKSGTTPNTYSLSLGFKYTRKPIEITGGISQTPVDRLAGSFSAPYEAPLSAYAVNAVNGWWEDACESNFYGRCWRWDGSQNFQGTVVEGMWELPQVQPANTYTFLMDRYIHYFCANPFGC